MMEPYRPFVDMLVIQWIENNPDIEELSKEAKAYFLNIASKDVRIDGLVRPLMVGIKTTISSLYKCYTGEKRLISYPNLL